MNTKEAFTVLKSNQSMDYREVRKSYIDLVSVWHPDRFTHNERLRGKAIEEMKQINIAWEIVENNFKVRKESFSINQSAPQKTAILITCSNCGTKNRIRRTRSLASSMKCGKCRTNLHAGSNSTGRKFEEAFEEIRFCAVDSCTGRIRTNGRCNQCGKTLEEGYKTRATVNTKRDIKVLIIILSGGLILFFSYLIGPENTTNITSKSSQLHYEANGSAIPKNGTKYSSISNDKGPELPLSVDRKIQNVTSKDIIVPFEILKK